MYVTVWLCLKGDIKGDHNRAKQDESEKKDARGEEEETQIEGGGHTGQS